MSNSVLSNLSSNGSTISGGRTPESSLAEDPDKTLSGPGVPAVCESCPEGETSHQSLVVCLSCPDQPALCQLCKEAHLRVALTRNHTLKFLLPNHLAENVEKLIALSTEEEFKDGENFDSNLQITTTELVKNWTELTSNLDDSVTRNHRLVAEEKLDKEFLPLFLSGPDDLSVKNRMSRILIFLLGERLVHPAELVNPEAVRVIQSMIVSQHTETILASLNLLLVLIKDLGNLNMKTGLDFLFNNLQRFLQHLEEKRNAYIVRIRGKAEEALLEFKEYNLT